MIKRNWIYILFAFSVIVFAISEIRKSVSRPEIIAKSLFLGNGWGVQIFINKKLYITMDRIPGIQGNKAFKSEEQALKVAELAIFKIKNKKSLPNIVTKELDSLGIER